jgi:hypothetical protein
MNTYLVKHLKYKIDVVKHHFNRRIVFARDNLK